MGDSTRLAQAYHVSFSGNVRDTLGIRTGRIEDVTITYGAGLSIEIGSYRELADSPFGSSGLSRLLSGSHGAKIDRTVITESLDEVEAAIREVAATYLNAEGVEGVSEDQIREALDEICAVHLLEIRAQEAYLAVKEEAKEGSPA